MISKYKSVMEEKMKGNIFGILVVLAGLAIMGCSSSGAGTPASDKTITLLTIPGVTAPVKGESPVMTAIDTPQYTGTIAWEGMPATFEARTQYTANIVLKAKAGWTLKGVAANSFTIVGAMATVTNAVNTGIVTALFPETGAVAVVFSGLTQDGGTSNYVSSTSLILSFSVDPTTLTVSDIILTGATKGALTGSGLTRSLAISDISVADGATVSVAVASPAGFSITNTPLTTVVYKAPTINLLAIPGIVIPVLGFPLVTTAINTAQYTGTISWSPTNSPFGESEAYTAHIVLTAKAGWTLTGVAANSFSVVGAMVTNTKNSGVVVARFLATNGVTPGNYSSTNIGILRGVPSGTFSRDGTVSNNSTVSSFRMSQYEITRAQYTAVTLATDPSNTVYSNGTSGPVQMVTWYDAIEFCNKLSLKEGFSAVYTISGRTPATGHPITAATVTVSDWNVNGYRLPTEMEWMWAAMGATSGTTGYSKAFAGSTGTNAIGNYAVFGYGTGETGSTTTERSNAVGSKTTGANELGLYDMCGNVCEWNWDYYGTFPTGANIDYRGSTTGTKRIMRGGSWGSPSSFCFMTFRDLDDPFYQGGAVGFRVVRH